MEINLNGSIFEQDENGEWIFKADKSAEFKKDGTLKAKYKDLPRYDLIYKYEDYFRDQFNNTLKQIKQDLDSKMKKLIK